MRPSAWRGRRVLVTGHTGFKGAWLSLWLASLGARVHGYALAPPTRPSLYEDAGVNDLLSESAIHDVRNLDELRQFAQRAQPEVVIHLAAQSLVRISYDAPADTFSTNVLGTVNLLEAIRAVPSAKAVLVATTDKCYANDGRSGGYGETDRLGGNDPYSSSKACAELAVHACRASLFGARDAAIATARAGNVVGGGDWSRDRLIPDLAAACSSGQPARLRNPESTRPWQHVLDVLRGYLDLCEALLRDGPAFAEAWNFGPAEQEARSVAWIAERFAAAWGSAPGWVRDTGAHPAEASWLQLDSSKARARLGWQALLSSAEAVAWTAEWYRGHARDASRAAELCHAQIERFEKLVPA